MFGKSCCVAPLSLSLYEDQNNLYCSCHGNQVTVSQVLMWGGTMSKSQRGEKKKTGEETEVWRAVGAKIKNK